jgi:hypothetical protein
MITYGEIVSAKEKGKYWIRAEKVEANLLEFGFSAGSVRKFVECYPIGLLERLIRETGKRQPSNPASYFLKGLKKSRMKHRAQHNLIGDEDT